jgi:arginine deiminase
VGHTHGVDSEVGRLRTVLAHRPGAELLRITPRTKDRLQFPGVPWMARAQQEHDIAAQCLRDQGVEVLYVMELLQDVMEYPTARAEAIVAVLGAQHLGERLRADLGSHLASLDPEELAHVLVAGLSPEEFRPGHGVAFGLMDRHDFVIPPLPNLMFLGDSHLWIGPAVAMASMDPPRRREAALIRSLYRHHPRFAGVACVYGPEQEPLDAGDLLQLAPGVIAAGISERTTAAGVERLASGLFRAGLATAVLAVPLRQLPEGTRLDTVCTVIDCDTVLMFPALAYVLQAHVITSAGGELRLSRPMPFLESMAQAMGVEALTVIGTGVDPPAASQRQWDDGGNALAVDRRRMLCYERNVETNARLEAAGVEVIRIPGSELSGARGGPRALSCPVSRDSVAAPAAAPAHAAAPALTLVSGEQALVPGPATPDVAELASETAALASETAALESQTAALTPEAAALAAAEPVVPVASAEAQTATMAGLATH